MRNDLCETLDLARTLLALAGIESPTNFKGRDLFSSPPPEAIYSTIGYGFSSSNTFPNLFHDKYIGNHGWPRRACIRTSNYRLDKNVRMDGKEVKKDEEDIFFVNWKEDPEENHNLAHYPKYKKIVEELSEMLDQHISNSNEPPKEYTEYPKYIKKLHKSLIKYLRALMRHQ